MPWEIVIGLETHVQLATHAKIFSGAATAFGAPPNTQACAVDLAMPGVLPVLNYGAVEKAIQFGLAVGAHINRKSIFARKNYFYPDLPKGYQISQYESPIVVGGSILITHNDGNEKSIQLTRAHLEEDAGKSLHEDFQGMSGIDLNRAGTPLLEIVSEPDMHSAQEAVLYAKHLLGLVTYLGICDGNLQEGSFRMDANISVRPLGNSQLGTRCEIKNLNSFRFLEKAILFEARRQIDVLEDGGTIHQETRLYDAERNETRVMRSKEDAHDYRYFPDPDLLPVLIEESFIERLKANLPELPTTKKVRFMEQYGLSAYDAALLTNEQDLAHYFENTVQIAQNDPKIAANWLLGEFSAKLNETQLPITQSPLSPEQLAGLLQRVIDGTISNKMAKEIFQALWAGEGTSTDALIAQRGLQQINDSDTISQVIEAILVANPTQVSEFQNGKEKAFNFLVGQIMKAMQGKANPNQVNELLRQRLK